MVDAIYLCTDRTCQEGVYLVPEHLHTRVDVMTSMMRYLKRTGYEFIPAIKCDLDDFPSPPPIVFGLPEGTAIFNIKLAGDLILRNIHSINPMTYGASGLMSFNLNTEMVVEHYVMNWKLKACKIKDSNILNVTFGNSITHEETNFDITIDGNTISASTTLPPTRTVYDKWEIEGQVSLTILGTINENDQNPPPAPAVSGSYDMAGSTAQQVEAATPVFILGILIVIAFSPIGL
jgi:hypothetical protein